MQPFSFQIGSIRPKPGAEPGSIELPGPGLYEADFRVPGWLASVLETFGADELDINREFTAPFANGLNLEHIKTEWRGESLTIRARLVDAPQGRSNKPSIQSAGTVKTLVLAIAKHWKITIGAAIIAGIASAIREVRLFAEVQPLTAGVVGISGVLLLTGAFTLRRG